MSLHHTVETGRPRRLALTLTSRLHTMDVADAPSRPYLPMNQQVFYDPQRKPGSGCAASSTCLPCLDLCSEASLWSPHAHEAAAGAVAAGPEAKLPRAGQPVGGCIQFRRSPIAEDLKPGDVPLNSGEGLRAAYYVEDDPASYSSLKQHISQIDLLFPEWLQRHHAGRQTERLRRRQQPPCGRRSWHVRPVDREAKVAALSPPTT